MGSPAWPPVLQQAREQLEQALAEADSPEQAQAAKQRFLQAIAGQVYPEEVVPALLAFLQAHGFEVGQPFHRS